MGRWAIGVVALVPFLPMACYGAPAIPDGGTGNDATADTTLPDNASPDVRDGSFGEAGKKDAKSDAADTGVGDASDSGAGSDASDASNDAPDGD